MMIDVSALVMVKQGEGSSSVFMKTRILAWNERRLNKGKKYLRVRSLLKDWKVDIVCFQETKLDAMLHIIVRNLWGCNHVDCCCLDSNGA